MLLKELSLIRVMLDFDFLDPRWSTLERIHFLLLQKLARVPLKNVFALRLLFPVNVIQVQIFLI